MQTNDLYRAGSIYGVLWSKLHEDGLNFNEADAVLINLMATSKAIADRWNERASDYPSHFIDGLQWMAHTVAVNWLAQNNPGHWAFSNFVREANNYLKRVPVVDDLYKAEDPKNDILACFRAAAEEVTGSPAVYSVMLQHTKSSVEPENEIVAINADVRREFDLSDVLSVTAKHILSDQGPYGVREIFRYITGDEHISDHGILRDEKSRIVILQQYPQLEKVQFPDMENVAQADHGQFITDWLAQQKIIFGEKLSISPMQNDVALSSQETIVPETQEPGFLNKHKRLISYASAAAILLTADATLLNYRRGNKAEKSPVATNIDKISAQMKSDSEKVYLPDGLIPLVRDEVNSGAFKNTPEIAGHRVKAELTTVLAKEDWVHVVSSLQNQAYVDFNGVGRTHTSRVEGVKLYYLADHVAEKHDLHNPNAESARRNAEYLTEKKFNVKFAK